MFVAALTRLTRRIARSARLLRAFALLEELPVEPRHARAAAARDTALHAGIRPIAASCAAAARSSRLAGRAAAASSGPVDSPPSPGALPQSSERDRAGNGPAHGPGRSPRSPPAHPHRRTVSARRRARRAGTAPRPFAHCLTPVAGAAAAFRAPTRLLRHRALG